MVLLEEDFHFREKRTPYISVTREDSFIDETSATFSSNIIEKRGGQYSVYID